MNVDNLEQQLRGLVPQPNASDPATLMYRCGFAAGRAEGIAQASPRPRSSGWAIAAMLVASLASAGGGYGLARRGQTQRVIVAQERAVQDDNTVQPDELATHQSPRAEHHRTPPGIHSVATSEPTAGEPGTGVTQPRPSQASAGVWAPGLIKKLVGDWDIPAIRAPGEAVVLTARSDSTALQDWLGASSHSHSLSSDTPAATTAGASAPATSADTLTPRSAMPQAVWKQWIQ